MPNIKKGMMAAAGVDTGCADCGLFVWGNNEKGQLGLGDTTGRSSPVQVYAAVPTDFSGGYKFSAFIDEDGGLWTVGLNDQGQLGQGDTTDLSTFTQVGSLTTWDQISCGNDHWIARKTDGTIWTCGSGSKRDPPHSSPISSPAQVGSDSDWTTVMTFGEGISAFKGTSLYSWGHGDDGQMGDGNMLDYTVPTLIGTGYVNSVRSSNGKSAWLNNQIKTDNTIWVAGWGYKGSGGTGDSGDPYYSDYTQIGSETDWTWVTFGQFGNMARRTDGSLYSWGWNVFGSLGTDDATSYSSPVLVAGGETWGAGFRHGACGSLGRAAINTSGELFAWGSNASGECGLGDTTNYSTPQQVGSETDWTAIDRGTHHALGVRTE